MNVSEGAFEFLLAPTKESKATAAGWAWFSSLKRASTCDGLDLEATNDHGILAYVVYDPFRAGSHVCLKMSDGKDADTARAVEEMIEIAHSRGQDWVKSITGAEQAKYREPSEPKLIDDRMSFLGLLSDVDHEVGEEKAAAARLSTKTQTPPQPVVGLADTPSIQKAHSDWKMRVEGLQYDLNSLYDERQIYNRDTPDCGMLQSICDERTRKSQRELARIDKEIRDKKDQIRDLGREPKYDERDPDGQYLLDGIASAPTSVGSSSSANHSTSASRGSSGSKSSDCPNPPCPPGASCAVSAVYNHCENGVWTDGRGHTPP